MVSPISQKQFSVFYKLNAEEQNYDKVRTLEDQFERSLKDKDLNYDVFEENSFKYFRELNRLGEYMAVKRLYEKYNSSTDAPPSERVKEQYMFAVENLRSLQQAAILASRKESTSRKKYRFVVLDEIFNIFTWMVILYLGLIFLTSLDLKMPDETMKFEIKMADDIKVRLDDVKGIDEIKDEVKNLIKMIKNPYKYKSRGAKVHKGMTILMYMWVIFYRCVTFWRTRCWKDVISKSNSRRSRSQLYLLYWIYIRRGLCRCRC